MTTVYDVPPGKLIKAAASDLKENIKLKRPEWSLDVKTGAQKERQPDDVDWWWARAASVLRKVYVNGPIGVQKLRVAYGGKKNRGHKPEKYYCGSGKNIRVILQEFDKLGFTEKTLKPKVGRILTPKGRSYLDKIASNIARQNA